MRGSNKHDCKHLKAIGRYSRYVITWKHCLQSLFRFSMKTTPAMPRKMTLKKKLCFSKLLCNCFKMFNLSNVTCLGNLHAHQFRVWWWGVLSIGIVLYVIDCWLTFVKSNTWGTGARVIYYSCSMWMREIICLQYRPHALQLTLA